VPEREAFVTAPLNWYALYVRSRHEFVTQEELRRKGIDVYLPAVKRMSRWKDRKKCIEYPIFPGYLFVFLQAYQEAFVTALRTRGVVSLLSLQPGSPTPVSSEEIESLKLLLESGHDFDICPSLQAGSKVRVTRGPLKGAFGTVVNKEEHYMFRVNIDILGRSVGVCIGADDIELD
jgi:transcriptional antiterminator NusG